MAVIFIDGFDHYTDWMDKWDANYLNPAITSASITPYGYGRALVIERGIYGSWVRKQLINKDGIQSTDNTLVFGVNGYPNQSGSGPTTYIIGNDNTIQFGVQIVGGNALVKVKSGTGTQTIATLIGAFTGNAWSFLEMKMEVNYSGSTDRLTMRIGGTQVGQWTGDWLTAPNWGHIEFQNESPLIGSNEARVDDLYVLDGSGTRTNDFLGVCRVVYTVPNAIGPNNEFVATGGDTTVTAVDDAIAIRTDANWIENGVLNSQQNYDQINLSSLGLTILQVYAVQTVNYVRKSDAQTVLYRNQIVANGAVYNGFEQLDPTTTFKCHSQIWDKYPVDSSDWDETKADLCGSGIKVSFKDIV